MKGNKHKKKKQQSAAVYVGGVQSFIFCWQIATE